VFGVVGGLFLLQEIYSIKLPGRVFLGEGKAENQNLAIIFTRGDALQKIDMNQDNYLEETLKMRNLLEEFDSKKHGLRSPNILGVREHVFTGSVSSLAWFMSMQEITFVTIGQRVLARPLKVRMHYGHSDVFDRLFHISRGGISKASKQINLSCDTFTGLKRELSAQCFLVKTQILSSKEKHLELGVELFLVSLCEFLEASLLPQYRP
jgi:callose synthase